MKHTNTVKQQYCRAGRKKLPLPARQRRQLLAGLQEELAESAPDCATLDALIAQFGTPDETAQELLSSISPEQLQTYQKQYRRRCILAAALAILLICCAALAYCQRMMQSSIAYATEHITKFHLTTVDINNQSIKFMNLGRQYFISQIEFRLNRNIGSRIKPTT